MAGVWKRIGQYLGLVEDEDLQELDEGVGAADRVESPIRRLARTELGSADRMDVVDRPEAIVRTMPTPRPGAAIHRAEPKRFDEARDIGERFRDGVPVIMNLQGANDHTARRLVDFASGLVFGVNGKIERVADRVYLLTPANVEVSAEERDRIAEGGFFNQL